VLTPSVVESSRGCSPAYSVMNCAYFFTCTLKANGGSFDNTMGDIEYTSVGVFGGTVELMDGPLTCAYTATYTS
jgi:hypothetical protein